jgi:hypothetical protein
MWVFIFILFVILLFYPQNTEQFANQWNLKNFQRSIVDKEPTKIKDYFENPMVNCPQNYEIAMDALNESKSEEKYYGYTGSQHRYIDNRYIDWKKVKEPLPVYADFFM